jgi:hypothetical protein
MARLPAIFSDKFNIQAAMATDRVTFDLLE